MKTMSKYEIQLSRALANALDMLVHDYGASDNDVDAILAPLSKTDRTEFIDGLFGEDEEEEH